MAITWARGTVCSFLTFYKEERVCNREGGLYLDTGEENVAYLLHPPPLKRTEHREGRKRKGRTREDKQQNQHPKSKIRTSSK